MASNIITPEFRGCFLGIFRATRMKDQPESKPRFSIKAAFAPTADLSALKAEAKAVAAEKWGANIPKNVRSPFRRNDELDSPVPGIADDWIIVAFAASEERRPGIVDAKLQDIIDEAECYSGAWYRAQVRAYAYDTAGNKGVAFGLQNVQKLRDGEPLGGRIPASKAFEAVEMAGASSASDLFD